VTQVEQHNGKFDVLIVCLFLRGGVFVFYLRCMRFLPGRCMAKGRGVRLVWTDWYMKVPTQQLFRCTRWDIIMCSETCIISVFLLYLQCVCFPSGPFSASKLWDPSWWAEPEASSVLLLGTLVEMVQVSTTGPHQGVLWREDCSLLCMAGWILIFIYTYYLISTLPHVEVILFIWFV